MEDNLTLSNYKQQLKELTDFMSTKAYSSVMATIKLQIEEKQDLILSVAPRSSEDLAQLQYNFGVRDNLQDTLNLFEEGRSTLEARISEITESDAQKDR